MLSVRSGRADELWFTSIYILLFRQKQAGIHFWTFVPRPADGRFCLAGILKSSWTTNISKLRLLLLNSHRNTSMTEGMSLIYWHQFYTHTVQFANQSLSDAQSHSFQVISWQLIHDACGFSHRSPGCSCFARLLYLFFILWVPQTAVESWYIREIAPMRSYWPQIYMSNAEH